MQNAKCTMWEGGASHSITLSADELQKNGCKRLCRSARLGDDPRSSKAKQQDREFAYHRRSRPLWTQTFRELQLPASQGARRGHRCQETTRCLIVIVPQHIVALFGDRACHISIARLVLWCQANVRKVDRLFPKRRRIFRRATKGREVSGPTLRTTSDASTL